MAHRSGITAPLKIKTEGANEVNRPMSIMTAGMILLILMTGCASTLGKFPYLSTKPDRGDLHKADKIAEKVIGVDCRWTILIPQFRSPEISKALEDAMSKVNGDFMTEATVTARSFEMPMLYNYLCYEVAGSAWKWRAGDARIEPPTKALGAGRDKNQETAGGAANAAGR
jgi:hypothetical protein